MRPLWEDGGNKNQMRNAKKMLQTAMPLMALIVTGAVSFCGCSEEMSCKDPESAYQSYVKAVEDGDYERFQWTVDNPISEDVFYVRCDQRKKKNIAPIKEGVGDGAWSNDHTEFRAHPLSPWNGERTSLTFKRSSGSWKVLERNDN